MRSLVRDDEEPRRVLSLDELEGELGEGLGLEALGGPRLAVNDELLVEVGPWPLVRREVIEPGHGARTGVGEVPLADPGGRVALLLERFREEGKPRAPVVSGPVDPDPVGRGPCPGQEGGTGGCAPAGGRIAPREHGALVGESIQVGRREERASEGRCAVEAQVVTVDDEEVRRVTSITSCVRDIRLGSAGCEDPERDEHEPARPGHRCPLSSRSASSRASMRVRSLPRRSWRSTDSRGSCSRSYSWTAPVARSLISLSCSS